MSPAGSPGEPGGSAAIGPDRNSAPGKIEPGASWTLMPIEPVGKDAPLANVTLPATTLRDSNTPCDDGGVSCHCCTWYGRTVEPARSNTVISVR